MPISDINCDMDENSGAWEMGSDAAILNYINSPNIACGFHADTPAQAVRDVDLVFFGLAGSAMIEETKSPGLRTAREVFADRTYQTDASLAPCSQPNAMITDLNKSIEQVLSMVQHG